MHLTDREIQLCQTLRAFPYQHFLRYTGQASQALQRTLFTSLVANNDEYLQALFHGREPGPGEEWNLSKAQGLSEDMEYTEAARGKACGHIFKAGDSVFRCKTCTTDDTAVLCTRCFEASDHTGHIVNQSISMGNTGCCDCGDAEAWKIPVECAIHTAHKSKKAGKQAQVPALPEELLECIKMTIGRALDYVIDVIACSPENLRLPKTAETIEQDESQSRLSSAWYDEPEDPSPEYSLVLWNDEKHTVIEVEQQVARACKQKRAFGRQRAAEANDYGRSVVEHSDNIPRLLKIAKIIEQIKITVTIRSSRDTFREQMCGTIIEWLNDIAGCSVGPHHDILTQTVCDELLKPWRLGSTGSNKHIGKGGLDDHEIEEHSSSSFLRRQQILRGWTTRLAREDSDTDSVNNDAEEDDEEEDEDFQHSVTEESVGVDQMDLDIMTSANTGASRDQEMRAPNDMEDGAELSEATFAGYPPPPPPPPPAPVHQHSRNLSIGSQISGSFANISFAPFTSKTNVSIPSTPKVARKKTQPRPPGYWLEQPDQFAPGDSMSVQEDLLRRIRLDWLLLYDLRLWKKIANPIFQSSISLYKHYTTPSVTQEVIERGNFLTTLMSMLYTFLTQRAVLQPWQVSVDDSMASENNSVHNRRMYHFFADLKYMFCAEYVQNELRTQERYQLQFLDLIRLPQGICPNMRAVGDHVEYENDIWISAQILTKEVNKLVRQFSEIFKIQESLKDHENLYRAIRLVAKAVIINSMGENESDLIRRRSDVRLASKNWNCTTLSALPTHSTVIWLWIFLWRQRRSVFITHSITCCPG
ncbi:uncharacterized protein KY384_002524 [Bacidia gigantensis]|uniref:uncharacterized protein n=1 Tax=Bacidia gigantensis TaxID=2732470 RepID=UPI001D052D5C|nr:uncharacterized protein KY384_002524 [Bacidia gigantensis]KAG8532647.1 hypothetical protein KY384_002524 [Bacidia gigantensis]